MSIQGPIDNSFKKFPLPTKQQPKMPNVTKGGRRISHKNKDSQVSKSWSECIQKEVQRLITSNQSIDRIKVLALGVVGATPILALAATVHKSQLLKFSFKENEIGRGATEGAIKIISNKIKEFIPNHDPKIVSSSRIIQNFCEKKYKPLIAFGGVFAIGLIGLFILYKAKIALVEKNYKEEEDKFGEKIMNFKARLEKIQSQLAIQQSETPKGSLRISPTEQEKSQTTEQKRLFQQPFKEIKKDKGSNSNTNEIFNIEQFILDIKKRLKEHDLKKAEIEAIVNIINKFVAREITTGEFRNAIENLLRKSLSSQKCVDHSLIESTKTELVEDLTINFSSNQLSIANDNQIRDKADNGIPPFLKSQQDIASLSSYMNGVLDKVYEFVEKEAVKNYPHSNLRPTKDQTIIAIEDYFLLNNRINAWKNSAKSLSFDELTKDTEILSMGDEIMSISGDILNDVLEDIKEWNKNEVVKSNVTKKPLTIEDVLVYQGEIDLQLQRPYVYFAYFYLAQAFHLLINLFDERKNEALLKEFCSEWKNAFFEEKNTRHKSWKKIYEEGYRKVFNRKI